MPACTGRCNPMGCYICFHAWLARPWSGDPPPISTAASPYWRNHINPPARPASEEKAMNRNEAYSLTDTMVKEASVQDRAACSSYANPSASPASAVIHALCLLTGRVAACHDHLDKLQEALGMALRPAFGKAPGPNEKPEREAGASELVERLLCFGDDLAGVIQRIAELNQRLTL